jgi:hypothetical protein
MESKDYERHSETITIPPTYVGQSLTHLGAVKYYARASNLVNKSGSEPQLECTPYWLQIKAQAQWARA